MSISYEWISKAPNNGWTLENVWNVFTRKNSWNTAAGYGIPIKNPRNYNDAKDVHQLIDARGNAINRNLIRNWLKKQFPVITKEELYYTVIIRKKIINILKKKLEIFSLQVACYQHHADKGHCRDCHRGEFRGRLADFGYRVKRCRNYGGSGCPWWLEICHIGKFVGVCGCWFDGYGNGLWPHAIMIDYEGLFNYTRRNLGPPIRGRHKLNAGGKCVNNFNMLTTAISDAGSDCVRKFCFSAYANISHNTAVRKATLVENGDYG